MAIVDPKFGEALKEFGAENINACYNCGTCTAVCSLSTPEDSFPREIVRLSVLGLEDDLKSSLKPWLCYYCGECTTHCPQTANPGELMMSIRRWLTSVYDWTGLSGLLYKSLPLTIASFIIVALAVIGYGQYVHFNPERIIHSGHYFEMIAIATVFAVIILPNIMRMWWFVILKPKIKVSFSSYMKSTWELIVHMFTQKRSLDCDNNRFRWFEHLILVAGYLTLLFTTVFLDWFSTENIVIIILGYLVSMVIFVVTFDFMISRVKKNREINKFSQPSDWFFVIWLFLMGFTAFIVRSFIDLHMLDTYMWIYLVHLIILAQWAIIIVPFGKWTHFVYRSFAMYFAKLKEVSLH
jgi:ferredoxin